jgi:hypothetical protein
MRVIRTIKKVFRRFGHKLIRPRTPRVIMTLLCRNEADVVGEQIAFHLAMGVDFVIAMDNNSEDGTVETLRHFERGGRLRLLHQPARDFDQGGWVTSMARMAALEHGADWVINSDCDEFWWPRTGDFKSTFAALRPKVNLVCAQRVNFRPSRSDDQPFYDRMLVREHASEKFRGGALEPKVAHRAYPDVTVHHGNHGVTLGERKAVEAPPGTIQILHFPVRTYERWQRRIGEGAAILDDYPDHPPYVTRGWRYLREHHLDKGTLRAYYEGLALDPEDLKAASDRDNLTIDTRVRDLLRVNRHLLPAHASGEPRCRGA